MSRIPMVGDPKPFSQRVADGEFEHPLVSLAKMYCDTLKMISEADTQEERQDLEKVHAMTRKTLQEYGYEMVPTGAGALQLKRR